MIPERAESAIAPMTATGIAISSGHGVAITNTARKRCGSPLSIQASECNQDCGRRIPRAQLVPKAAQPGAPLLGLLHYVHDPRVPGIDGQFGGPNGQGSFSVQRPRDDFGAWGLRNLERLSGQEGLVHPSVAFDHNPIRWANLVRIDEQEVPDLTWSKVTSTVCAPTCGGSSAACDSPKYRGWKRRDERRTPQARCLRKASERQWNPPDIRPEEPRSGSRSPPRGPTQIRGPLACGPK